MEWTKIERPEIIIAGITARTRNDDEGRLAIQQLWERFFSEDWASKIQHPASGKVYGAYYDYETDHTGAYTCLAGLSVLSDDQPNGVEVITIPAQSYARFNVPGPFPQGLIDTWYWIWESALPRTYTVDFEEYPEEFHPSDRPRHEIFVAI